MPIKIDDQGNYYWTDDSKTLMEHFMQDSIRNPVTNDLDTRTSITYSLASPRSYNNDQVKRYKEVKSFMTKYNELTDRHNYLFRDYTYINSQYLFLPSWYSYKEMEDIGNILVPNYNFQYIEPVTFEQTEEMLDNGYQFNPDGQLTRPIPVQSSSCLSCMSPPNAD